MSRKTLYSRINKRVGYYVWITDLFREVQQLVEQGYESRQSMQAIGYKELIPVINGQMIYEDAVNDLKATFTPILQNDQMTWFKNK